MIEEALATGNLDSSAIDWLVLHQANQRILDSAAKRLEISTDRVISNLCNYGNTSAASIPLALDESVRNGKIQPGDTVMPVIHSRFLRSSKNDNGNLLLRADFVFFR